METSPKMGRTVVFEVDPVTLLIREPRDHKMAVLKTASNFQYFAPVTSRLIRVNTTGPGQSDVGLPWKSVPRPIYPLDHIASWRG